MSDVGVSDAFALGLLLIIVLYFCVGFIPGFYFSYLILSKRIGGGYEAFMINLFIGIFCGVFSTNQYILLFPLPNFFVILYKFLFFTNFFYCIVPVELILVSLHFFYFRKQKISK